MNNESPNRWWPGVKIKEMERWMIQGALNHFKGNKTKAALSLGISIRTIRNKINRYRKEGHPL